MPANLSPHWPKNMAARSSKLKKPSAGSAPFPSPPEDFVLYLDENLSNSRAILETLTKLAVRSPTPSELYPFLFFLLRAHSNRCVHLANASTINGIDKFNN